MDAAVKRKLRSNAPFMALNEVVEIAGLVCRSRGNVKRAALVEEPVEKFFALHSVLKLPLEVPDFGFKLAGQAVTQAPKKERNS